MSTLVLARKYRPRSFAEMVGQEHVVQALANALTQQRLHHAYLFTGTRGVGKTTVSRILAKSLNCTGADGQGGITAQPCGVCDACRDIDAGRFVDYVELDAASNRGVEEITQLLDQAVYKPVLGRFKVYMIDEVHMLSNTAFNAMLKTLEEPPEYLKFVLATTDPQKVPPTVLSRCLQFNLRPMAPQTVQEHLADVLRREGIAAEPGALRLLARARARLDARRLSLTDQAIAFGAGALDEDGVRRHARRGGPQPRGAPRRGARRSATAPRWWQPSTPCAGSACPRPARSRRWRPCCSRWRCCRSCPARPTPTIPTRRRATRLAAALAPDETQLLYSIVLHGRAELGLAPDEYSGARDGAAAHAGVPSGRAGAASPRSRRRRSAARGRGACRRGWPRPSCRHARCGDRDGGRASLPWLAPAPAAARRRRRRREPPPWLDAPDEDIPPGQAVAPDPCSRCLTPEPGRRAAS